MEPPSASLTFNAGNKWTFPTIPDAFSPPSGIYSQSAQSPTEGFVVWLKKSIH